MCVCVCVWESVYTCFTTIIIRKRERKNWRRNTSSDTHRCDEKSRVIVYLPAYLPTAGSVIILCYYKCYTNKTSDDAGHHSIMLCARMHYIIIPKRERRRISTFDKWNSRAVRITAVFRAWYITRQRVHYVWDTCRQKEPFRDFRPRAFSASRGSYRMLCIHVASTSYITTARVCAAHDGSFLSSPRHLTAVSRWREGTSRRAVRRRDSVDGPKLMLFTSRCSHRSRAVVVVVRRSSFVVPKLFRYF